MEHAPKRLVCIVQDNGCAYIFDAKNTYDDIATAYLNRHIETVERIVNRYNTIPALLKAAKQALAELEDIARNSGITPDDDEWKNNATMNALRSAIAKAKGE